MILVFALVSGTETPAQSPGASAEFQFDIPAQPLASSLKAYSAITNLELYYESSLIDRFQSSAIRGTLSADVALRRLLEGSGLSVASFERGTVTILPGRQPASRQDVAALKRRAAEFNPYFAVIQAGLRDAFCRVPAAQVDADELVIRLWIAPSGAVARADIASQAGSEERDRAYAAAIRMLVIDRPPPPAMPQPVTLLVMPRASRMAAECPEPDGSNPVRASSVP